MCRWVQLRWGLLALFVSLISPCLLCAQSPECLDRSSAVSHKSKKIKINIVGIEFWGEDSLSDVVRTKLVETIQRSEIEVSPEERDTHWANVLRATAINKTLFAQGYVGARTEVTSYLVRAEPNQRDYVVSLEIKTGPQYRIGIMQVQDATVFTPSELREQIPLNPGEIYNDDKVWQGIESMRQLYRTKGYIDMTAGVTQSIDESKRLIDAHVEVHEGSQYRVGNVEILGLGSRAENLLRSIPKPGQIFDSRSLTDFLKENKDVLPVDASENDIITVRSHSEDGTVGVLLDFRRCSKAQSTISTPSGSLTPD
jgi:outer membrane protein assembly factor BamA